MERPPMDDAMDEEATTPMDVAPPQPEETRRSTPELKPHPRPHSSVEEPDATMGTLTFSLTSPERLRSSTDSKLRPPPC